MNTQEERADAVQGRWRAPDSSVTVEITPDTLRITTGFITTAFQYEIVDDSTIRYRMPAPMDQIELRSHYRLANDSLELCLSGQACNALSRE